MAAGGGGVPDAGLSVTGFAPPMTGLRMSGLRITGFSFTVGADVAAVIADGMALGGAETPSSGVIGVKTVSSLISNLLNLLCEMVLNRHYFRFF